MSGYSVAAEALHGAAAQVKSVAVAGSEQTTSNLRAAVATLEESLGGAMGAAQKALAEWSGGQGSVAFDEASMGVRKDINQINMALNDAVLPAVAHLTALLQRFGQALDQAGNAYTETDAGVMGSFAGLAGG